jgi:hypothetical protein
MTTTIEMAHEQPNQYTKQLLTRTPHLLDLVTAITATTLKRTDLSATKKNESLRRALSDYLLIACGNHLLAQCTKKEIVALILKLSAEDKRIECYADWIEVTQRTIAVDLMGEPASNAKH